jgi:hypothetical protein
MPVPDQKAASGRPSSFVGTRQDDRKMVAHDRNPVAGNRKWVVCNGKGGVRNREMVASERETDVRDRKAFMHNRKVVACSRNADIRNRKVVIHSRHAVMRNY